MRPFGASTPALLTSTSSRPNVSVASATTASTSAISLTSAVSVSTAPRVSGRPSTVACERGRADVAQHDIGVGLAGELTRELGAERAARTGDHDDASATHTSRYPPSTFNTVPVTKADASDARNWYAPTSSAGAPHRRCAVCASTLAPSSGFFFHGSTSGESNHPGATTFTVMPGGREVERQTLGQADESRLRRAVRGEPFARPFAEHRTGEDHPPTLAHHPGRGTRAEERTGEVDVEDLAPHRRIGLARPGDDRRDPRVADPHVDAAPLGDGGVGDGFVEVLVGDLAGEHQGGAGELVGQRLEVGLGPRHQRDPGAVLGEGAGEPAAEAPAGAGHHHPLPADLIGHLAPAGVPVFVPISTIHG